MATKQKPEKATKKKFRSPNYPAVSLKEAMERVRKIYKADGRAGAPVASAVKLIGYSGAHGKAMTVLSALSKFGLTENKAGRIVPTPAAVDIIEFPATHDRHQKALRDAALSPAIYRNLIDRFRAAGALPSDESLKPELVADLKFSAAAASGFVTDFRESLEFAGLLDGNELKLSTSDGEAHDDEEYDGLPLPPSTERVRVGSYVVWLSHGKYHFDEPKKVLSISDDGKWVFVEGHPTGIPMDEAFVDRDLAGVIAPPPNPFFKSADLDEEIAAEGEALDRATLDEGPVVLRWPEELSAESVEEFEYWVNGLIKRARRKAGITPKSSDKSDE